MKPRINLIGAGNVASHLGAKLASEGVNVVTVSNAAGGVNLSFQVADLMVIEDHIDLTKENPLTGPNLDEFGGRFPDMSEPYERKMIDQALSIAKEEGIRCHEGVYAGVSGPHC